MGHGPLGAISSAAARRVLVLLNLRAGNLHDAIARLIALLSGLGR